MNVAYVQPIFCPNDDLFERNLKSVKSFVDYYLKNNYEFKCVFGGYCSKKKYFDILNAEFSRLSNVYVERFDKNYGKAYTVNNLTKHIEDVDYFLTADSDVVYLDNQPDMIGRLVEAVDFSDKIGQHAGIIGLSLLEHNVHLMELMTQYKREYVGMFTSECISRPHEALGGLGGGCLFIDNVLWKEIGGYKVLGVYAADDGNLMVDCRKSGRYFWLSQSIAAIHLMETNEEYQRWKIEHAPKILELNEAIEDANKFWRHK